MSWFLKNALVKILEDYDRTNNLADLEGFSNHDPFYKGGLTITSEENNRDSGVNGGQNYWIVLKVQKGSEITFWKICGCYYSYENPTLDFDKMIQVEPKEKMVKIWEQV